MIIVSGNLFSCYTILVFGAVVNNGVQMTLAGVATTFGVGISMPFGLL